MPPAKKGVRWVSHEHGMFPPRFRRLLRGRLNLRSYLQSLSGPLEFALVSADDLLPGLMDLPIFAFKHIYRMYSSLRKSGACRARMPCQGLTCEVRFCPAKI